MKRARQPIAVMIAFRKRNGNRLECQAGNLRSNGERNTLYVNIQSVPRSKHTSSG